MRRLFTSALGALLLLSGAPAGAAKVPFSFAPSVAANPSRTQQKISALEAKLPASFALPASLTTLTSNAPGGDVTLLFAPATAQLLERARTSGPGLMAWPGGTPSLCAKHDAFVPPASLLTQSPSNACRAAEQSIRDKLAFTGTCRDVEQPERYVLAAPRGVVNDTTTATVESLIALAGEVLSHYPPPANLLPADFVPTLRSVIWKIRRATLSAQLTKARALYKEALTTIQTQPTCFDPNASAALALALGDLGTELGAAEAHLAQVESSGKVAAQQELTCLGARGRTRGALPFPSLTADERRFVAFWLGGIYWRMRGGGLISLGDTQAARTQFVQRPFRRIGELSGGATGEEAGFRIYLNIFTGWADWMDMGTTPGGQDLYEDLVQMTDRGRQQVQDPATSNAGFPIPVKGLEGAAIFLAEKGYDPTPLLTGGLDMGPCYAYGLNPLKDFRYADTAMAPYNGTLIEGFTSVGELCTGAAIALGMADTLLEGTPTGAPANLCTGKQCGDDGCGGSCGTCGAGSTCEAGACVACTPSCVGKTCGANDGCGGRCDAGCEDASPRANAPSVPAAPDDLVREDGGCSCRVATPSGDHVAFGASAGLALVAALRARHRLRRRQAQQRWR